MKRIPRTIAAGVRSADMFGYNINLNFNRKGDSHKTVFGGIISLLVHAIIFAYVYIHLKKMFLFEDNKNYTEQSVANLMEKGKVNYADTRVLPYMVVRHQIHGQVFLDQEEIQRSFQIFYVQRYIDYYKPVDEFYTDTTYAARPCRESDFGPDDQDKYIFSTWNGYTIVCPDVPENQELFLMGDLSSMYGYRLLFQVLMCDNSTREGKLPCYPKEHIEEYMQNIQIDIWAYYESIDYNKYEGRPTYKVTDLQTQWLLTPSLTQNVILSLREHLVETQDSFFTVGSELSFEGNFYQVGKIDERPYVPHKYPGMFFQAEIILMSLKITHQREIYNLLDLLADLGGVYEILLLILGVIVLPISRHSFILKAIKKLYRGRTKDPSLFKIDRKLAMPTAYDANPRLAKEREKNRRIRVRFWDSLRLYFSRTCCKLCCSVHVWKNKDKFQKLFRIGDRRIAKELDIVKIMRNLKDIKICLRHSIMTDKIKQEIAHTNKKVIDLDDTGMGSSEVEEDTFDNDVRSPFSYLDQVTTTQQALNTSSSGENDETIFTSNTVKRSIQKSMFKIKLQKARRRALKFEQLDGRGDKFNTAIQRAAFQNFRRVQLTQHQAAVAIGRWWRRMLMRKFRLGQILDPVLEYRIGQALTAVSNNLPLEDFDNPVRKSTFAPSSSVETPGEIELTPSAAQKSRTSRRKASKKESSRSIGGKKRTQIKLNLDISS